MNFQSVRETEKGSGASQGPNHAVSLAQIFGDRLGARLDVQFFVDAPEICADGVDANAQLVGDLFVSKPLGQTIQNHFLAG